MADKQTIARAVRKSQRVIDDMKAKSCGMEGNNREKSMIHFVNECEKTMEEIKVQNGRIQAIQAGLDKESKKRKDYEAYLEDNEKYCEETKNIISANKDLFAKE